MSTPSRSGYGVDSDATSSKNYSFYPSPRVANKFEFTYPSTTSYVTGSSSTASPHHRHLNYSSVTSTPSSVRRTSAEHHHLPHHVAYQPHHFSGAASLPPSATATVPDQSKPSRERLSRLDTAASSASTASPDATPSHLLASPPSPSRERSYFPSSWRSTLSSWTTSWQSPLSLRRLRTASTDRSSGFDSTRRFQPSYRSWNEKDNYYGAMKR